MTAKVSGPTQLPGTPTVPVSHLFQRARGWGRSPPEDPAPVPHKPAVPPHAPSLALLQPDHARGAGSVQTGVRKRRTWLLVTVSRTLPAFANKKHSASPAPSTRTRATARAPRYFHGGYLRISDRQRRLPPLVSESLPARPGCS